MKKKTLIITGIIIGIVVTLFVAFLDSFTADIDIFDSFFFPWICNFPKLFYRPI